MKKSLRKSYLHKNNSGFTLVAVLMVLVVLSVLGLSILMITSNSVKISTGERDDQSVFYIAEAGLTVEMDELEAKIQKAYNDTNDANSFFVKLSSDIYKLGVPSTTTFEKSFGESPIAVIDVDELDSNSPTRKYKVTSTGSIGEKHRVVVREFSVTWVAKGGFGDMAVFVKEDINLDGKVTGDIGTFKEGAGSIKVGWDGNGSFHGDVYVPKGYEASAISRKPNMEFHPIVKPLGIIPEFELPEFPIIPLYSKSDPYNYISPGFGESTLILDKNTTMGKLNISGSHKLTIDVGDFDKELVLDELNLSGDGLIYIKGTGKLKLYVKKNIHISNGILNAQTITETIGGVVGDISKEHLRKLDIYYQGSEKFSVSSNLRIYASIYAEKADISITSSASIFGNIISGGKSFDVTGDGLVQPSLYFAPNAHFKVSGSGKVYGSIIGKSIDITGGGQVHYKTPNITGGIFPPGFGKSGTATVVKEALVEE